MGLANTQKQRKSLFNVIYLLVLTGITLSFNNCSDGFKSRQALLKSTNASSDSTPSPNSNQSDEEAELLANFSRIDLFNNKVYDESSKKNDLEINNLTVQNHVTGKEIVFNGSTSFAKINELSFSNSVTLKKFSITANLRSSEIENTYSRAIALSTSDNSQLLSIFRSGKNIGCSITGASDIVIKDFLSESLLGEHFHMVATYDGQTLFCYLNGNLKGQSSIKDIELIRPSLVLGKSNTQDSEYWYGALGHIRIYSRALDASDVSNIYKEDFTNPIQYSATQIFDGDWTSYGSWSSCPAQNCGNEIQTRIRYCAHPKPVNGGEICIGDSVDVKACPIANCTQDPDTGGGGMTPVVDGGWSEYFDVSTCSVSCGGGTKTQERTCTSPSPQNGGAPCDNSEGTSRQVACNTQACPDPGNQDPLPPPSSGEGGVIKISDVFDKKQNDQLNSLALKFSASHKAVNNGKWSSTSTWNNNQVPVSGSVVEIPANITVEYDVNSSVSLNAVLIKGFLRFSTGKDTLMKVETIMGLPGSRFEMGNYKNPIAASNKAEIVITNSGNSIDLSKDPGQHSRGVLLRGLVEIHGTPKRAYLPLDLPANNGRKVLSAGSTVINVKGNASNWSVGDEIVIMGTNKGGYQDEKRVIKSISGNKITLSSGLNYLHDTPSFQTNNITGINELNIYVGNLSRNVVISSEYTGTAEIKRRGYFAVLHADGADIRYASFLHLGRTNRSSRPNDEYYVGTGNPEGKYPLYISGAGIDYDRKPFALVGNAVAHSPGWGIVQRDSYGAVNYNFVYNVDGAGMVSEDGSESGEWVGNFVTNIHDVSNGRKLNQNDVQPTGDIGFDGICFESQSRVIHQRKNIAANCNVGWSFLAAMASRGFDKSLDPNDPNQAYFKNPLINTTRDPKLEWQQYNDRPGLVNGHHSLQFTNMNENESIALETGVNSWHRDRPWNYEFVNTISRHIGWRNGEVFNFVNYVGGYHIDRSLFVDVGVALQIQEKTKRSSLVHSHVENSGRAISDSGNKMNVYGVLYDVKEVNVGNTINGSMYPTILEKGGRTISGFGDGKLVLFDVPFVKVLNVGNLNPLDSPKLELINSPSVDPTRGFELKGYVVDSFGKRVIEGGSWLAGGHYFGNDGIFATADDHDGDYSSWTDVNLRGYSMVNFGRVRFNYPTPKYMKENSLNFEEVIKLYGVYNKNGKWVMPVPYWINDFYDGKPYPYMVDFAVSGVSASDLSKYELTSYPKVDKTGVYYGNPNINEDGSFKRTRTYAVKNWRVNVRDPEGVQ